MWSFTAEESKAVAFLQERLQAVPPTDEKVIANLVAELDAAAFATRQTALVELSKLDRLAEPALRRALAGRPSLEQHRRITQLLEQLESVPSADQLRSLRAVEVLEHIATAEARRLISSLAKGAPAARLTQEAKASLARLRG